MSKIFDSLTSNLRGFLKFLFDHFYRLFKDLLKAKSDIPFRYLVSDFIAVLRSAGMFTFFNLVAFIVFTFLPQGKDILLIIAEDISRSDPQFGNLVWLIIGVVFWSIVSEYGTRYSIYVTDNSRNNLSDERVVWRKAVQKATREIFLMLPYLIVLTGFVINYLQDTSLTESEKRWGFGIPALCLYLTFTVVAKFYFTDNRNELLAKPGAFTNFALLPDKEVEWCNKLLGIYNRYVFVLRKPSNFNKEINEPYRQFCANFLALPEAEKKTFPQSDMLEKKSRVPTEFTFYQFTDDGENTENDNPAGNYKWIYNIPLNFYATLHRQLKFIFLFSLILFGIICILPIKYYQVIGGPGLVVIAFGCWSGLYLGLLFMDFAYLRASRLSLRFVLLVCLVLCSWFNNDHPIRYNEYGTACLDNRPDLKTHFLKWFNRYRKDSLNTLYGLKSDTTAKEKFFPVVFICAEGGALRTGAFAAQTLSFLQDSIYKHYNIDVRNSVYAFSGVSGGALGISFFNAMAYLSQPGDLKQDTSFSTLTKLFFHEDYLSPVIGKMFYADIVSLFLPFHVQKFDRAIVLEKAWEDGFEKIIKKDSRNIFSSDIRSLYQDTSKLYPAIFINTTEAESGKQCWLSNVKPDSDVVFADKRDLLAYKVRGGINYSTMTNFSSRFPLFSPGAAVIQDDGKKFHYLDGGYVENTGTGTMLEILQALKPVFDTLALRDSTHRDPVKIKPFVLILQYNQYNSGPPYNIDFANEFSEVLNGMYNTRNGRATTALEQITRYAKKTGRTSIHHPPAENRQ